MTFVGFIKKTLRPLVDWVNPSSSVEAKLLPQKKAPITDIPQGRVSEPDEPAFGNVLQNLGEKYRVINHDFLVEIIDVIRRLVKYNPDISQALNNVVTLGNTGHKIFFDRKVSPEQVERMRNHLINRSKSWAPGVAGMDGLVNKMIAQIMIAGALSNEWVPEDDLSGLKACILIKPETIRFVLDKSKSRYMPYQKVNSLLGDSTDLIKLNEATYKYFALNGDTEIPYGYPPYMSVLERIKTQNRMHANIDYVSDIIGLVGFLELLLDKPQPMEGESDEAYVRRLDNLLLTAKARLKEGFRDGTAVGYKEDHEFKFNSAGTKDLSALLELYKSNEQHIFSGLKSDPTLAGRDYNTSETQITVIFMKMLSELKNLHNILKHNLEFGYSLELRLAGFQFEYLTVKFNRSTIQDDLKYQQAEEIKIRNVIWKYVLGVIDLEQAADELDYEIPAESLPRVPFEVLVGGAQPKQEEVQKDTKNKSAKKQRKKDKPIPKDK